MKTGHFSNFLEQKTDSWSIDDNLKRILIYFKKKEILLTVPIQNLADKTLTRQTSLSDRRLDSVNSLHLAKILCIDEKVI